MTDDQHDVTNTDNHPSDEHVTGEHLTDERLSAHLDGVDDVAPRGAPGLETHLASCALCQARLASLRSVRALVGTALSPVPAATRAAAVAAALDRARIDTSSGVAEPGWATPLRPGPGTTPWYRRPAVFAGAAAAVVALLVAIPVALEGGSPSAKSTNEAAPLTNGAASAPKSPHRVSSPSAAIPKGSATYGPAATPTTAGAPVVVPDLGAIDNAAQLPSAVAGVLSASASASGSAASGTSEAPSGLSAASETAPLSTCVASTRAEARGGAYGPAVVAEATFEGTPALVMEFWPTATAPAAGQGLIAVASVSGCSLLATVAS